MSIDSLAEKMGSIDASLLIKLLEPLKEGGVLSEE